MDRASRINNLRQFCHHFWREKMKKVTRIEMADSENIYSIQFGGELTVKPDGNSFTTYEGNHEINTYATEAWAIEANEESIVDDDLIVTGWGEQSGKKFWQLPEKLKAEIISEAMK
jgi:hypothetical protein